MDPSANFDSLDVEEEEDKVEIPSLMESTMSVVCQQLQGNIKTIDGILESISDILLSTSKELQTTSQRPSLKSESHGRIKCKIAVGKKRTVAVAEKASSTKNDIVDDEEDLHFEDTFGDEAVAFCTQIINESGDDTDFLEKRGKYILDSFEKTGSERSGIVSREKCIPDDNSHSPRNSKGSSISKAGPDSCSLSPSLPRNTLMSRPTRLGSSSLSLNNVKRLKNSGMSFDKPQVSIKRRRIDDQTSGQITPLNVSSLTSPPPTPLNLDDEFFTNSTQDYTAEEESNFRRLFPEMS